MRTSVLRAESIAGSRNAFRACSANLFVEAASGAQSTLLFLRSLRHDIRERFFHRFLLSPYLTVNLRSSPLATVIQNESNEVLL